MKGCAVAGLLDLLLFAAGWALLTWLKVANGVVLNDALGPGFLLAVPLWMGLKLLHGAWQILREKKMLDRRNELPVEGERCALSGTVHARSPLRAPLSGVPCSMFRYAILGVVGRGRNRTIATIYEGTAVTPSTIRTSTGSYRILAVPTFDFESELLEQETSVQNARQLVEETTFEVPLSARARSRSAEEWSDEDGDYRFDMSNTTAPPPLEDCRFQEFAVKEGEEVTVMGRYSVTRGGIVADANWANKTRIMKGPVERVVVSLNRRVRRYVIGGVVFSGIAIAAFNRLSP